MKVGPGKKDARPSSAGDLQGHRPRTEPAGAGGDTPAPPPPSPFPGGPLSSLTSRVTDLGPGAETLLLLCPKHHKNVLLYFAL